MYQNQTSNFSKLLRTTVNSGGVVGGPELPSSLQHDHAYGRDILSREYLWWYLATFSNEPTSRKDDVEYDLTR